MALSTSFLISVSGSMNLASRPGMPHNSDSDLLTARLGGALTLLGLVPLIPNVAA